MVEAPAGTALDRHGGAVMLGADAAGEAHALTGGGRGVAQAQAHPRAHQHGHYRALALALAGLVTRVCRGALDQLEIASGVGRGRAGLAELVKGEGIRGQVDLLVGHLVGGEPAAEREDPPRQDRVAVSYTHLRAHETDSY